ncbi:MAG: protein translocase subunit SecF, partial [Bacilli bacterium]
MLWYYRVAGVIAILALAVNTVLVLGTMALTKATITMPGIAGMVLTIGMAVDANVLIFERIREELRRGKTIGNAITAGYQRAFSSIFDSNLTTLVTAFFLYEFGTGTVKGFAVTLSFGIFASMFTAIFMTRAIFDLLIAKDIIKSLSMRSFKFLNNLNVDYLSYRKIAVAISIAFVAISLLCFAIRGNGMLGIDFAGGTEMSYECQGDAPDVEKIRAFLTSEHYSDNVRVGYKRGQSGERLLEIVLPIVAEDGMEKAVDYTAFNKKLDEAFPEVKISLKQTNTVGANVGKDFRNGAFFAAFFSIIGIIVYLAFRFEFRYGVAATVAVVHDAIVSCGLFMLLGGNLSLTVVAALMTIMGYSLNDTIVIFDRIRETKELNKDISYSELINKAVNECMSRTILTSLTTLLVVICLLLFGGGAIFDFALVMFFGCISGTYSTIFVASAIINSWHKRTLRSQKAEIKAKKAASAPATAKA